MLYTCCVLDGEPHRQTALGGRPSRHTGTGAAPRGQVRVPPTEQAAGPRPPLSTAGTPSLRHVPAAPPPPPPHREPSAPSPPCCPSRTDSGLGGDHAGARGGPLASAKQPRPVPGGPVPPRGAHGNAALPGATDELGPQWASRHGCAPNKASPPGCRSLQTPPQPASTSRRPRISPTGGLSGTTTVP